MKTLKEIQKLGFNALRTWIYNQFVAATIFKEYLGIAWIDPNDSYLVLFTCLNQDSNNYLGDLEFNNTSESVFQTTKVFDTRTTIVFSDSSLNLRFLNPTDNTSPLYFDTPLTVNRPYSIRISTRIPGTIPKLLSVIGYVTGNELRLKFDKEMSLDTIRGTIDFSGGITSYVYFVDNSGIPDKTIIVLTPTQPIVVGDLRNNIIYSGKLIHSLDCGFIEPFNTEVTYVIPKVNCIAFGFVDAHTIYLSFDSAIEIESLVGVSLVRSFDGQPISLGSFQVVTGSNDMIAYIHTANGAGFNLGEDYTLMIQTINGIKSQSGLLTCQALQTQNMY